MQKNRTYLLIAYFVCSITFVFTTCELSAQDNSDNSSSSAILLSEADKSHLSDQAKDHWYFAHGTGNTINSLLKRYGVKRNKQPVIESWYLVTGLSLTNGKFEERNVEYTDTAFYNEVQIDVPVDEYYSIEAVYVKDSDTIYVVDGDKFNLRKETEQCDEKCYYFKDGIYDVRLRE